MSLQADSVNNLQTSGWQYFKRAAIRKSYPDYRLEPLAIPLNVIPAM